MGGNVNSTWKWCGSSRDLDLRTGHHFPIDVFCLPKLISSARRRSGTLRSRFFCINPHIISGLNDPIINLNHYLFTILFYLFNALHEVVIREEQSVNTAY